jgi:hypothetical protein
MTNAYENENLEQQGQSVDNVGQDEGKTVEESSEQSWEDQAKYFQSEKDKLANENQSLKQYEVIGKLLQSRPDIANTVANMVQGGQAQPVRENIELNQDEFDPWEAYNDPKSKSYKFRQQELQNDIGQAVDHRMQGVVKQQGMQQLEGQLAKSGLSDQEISSFMNFAAKNPAEYGVDGAIKMWKAVMNENSEGNQPNALDNVRQTQNAPTPGGILQGQHPRAKNEDKSRWEGVMKASRVGNKIP